MGFLLRKPSGSVSQNSPVSATSSPFLITSLRPASIPQSKRAQGSPSFRSMEGGQKRGQEDSPESSERTEGTERTERTEGTEKTDRW